MRQRIVKNSTGNCTKNMYVENVGGLNGNWNFTQILLMSWWAEEHHFRMFFSFPQSEPSMHRISSTCALHARTHGRHTPCARPPMLTPKIGTISAPQNRQIKTTSALFMLFYSFFLSFSFYLLILSF